MGKGKDIRNLAGGMGAGGGSSGGGGGGGFNPFGGASILGKPKGDKSSAEHGSAGDKAKAAKIIKNQPGGSAKGAPPPPRAMARKGLAGGGGSGSGG